MLLHLLYIESFIAIRLEQSTNEALRSLREKAGECVIQVQYIGM